MVQRMIHCEVCLYNTMDYEYYETPTGAKIACGACGSRVSKHGWKRITLKKYDEILSIQQVLDE